MQQPGQVAAVFGIAESTKAQERISRLLVTAGDLEVIAEIEVRAVIKRIEVDAVLAALDGGAICLSMRCPVTDSLVRWVLQLGGCVQVEAPMTLKSLVVKNARDLLKTNGAPP
ncbi:MAG: WYL domain-containing protein [Chitinispirillaceae bacterium]|nr:WYL domain-containing protein [Chitinispirillaceae bacterium]